MRTEPNKILEAEYIVRTTCKYDLERPRTQWGVQGDMISNDGVVRNKRDTGCVGDGDAGRLSRFILCPTCVLCKKNVGRTHFPGCSLYSIFHVKRTPKYPSRHAQDDETNGSIVFVQSYPVAADDAVLRIGSAVIPALLLLEDHL